MLTFGNTKKEIMHWLYIKKGIGVKTAVSFENLTIKLNTQKKLETQCTRTKLC